MSLYSVRQTAYLSYRMVKFDEDFNVQEVWYLYKKGLFRDWNCDCWQKNKHTCRHRQMIDLFINNNKVNSGWFYDPDRKEWERPLNDPVRRLGQRRR